MGLSRNARNGTRAGESDASRPLPHGNIFWRPTLNGTQTTVPAWEVPSYSQAEFEPRRSAFCVGIPVINEGQKLLAQLGRMASVCASTDVIIGDGGSTDGSTAESVLRPLGVRTLLTKTGPGRLSAQMRMLFAYAIQQGYEGIV